MENPRHASTGQWILGTMKTDFKKDISSYAAKQGVFHVVTVPALNFLMLEGHGDPNSAGEYRDALATLYPVAYALKFFSKSELGQDYTVMPLEAQWWSEDMGAFTSDRDKSRWDWTVMNMVPSWLTQEQVDEAFRRVAAKGSAPALGKLRWESFEEGLCVQTLHTGSYDQEGPVLEEMHHAVIPSTGLTMTGRHHEIYLNDPRRTAPEKLKTILRQPVREGLGSRT